MRALAAKLRAVMPDESTVDLDRHAADIARLIFQARSAAVRRHADAMRTWLADVRHESAVNLERRSLDGSAPPA